ncbi:MAG: hypothetical protein ACJ74D_05280 [Gaiellaceae bacterium]
MIAARAYELEPAGRRLVFRGADGTMLAQLSLLSAFDRSDGVDETLAVDVRHDGATFEIERRSTIWTRAGATVECRPDSVAVRTWVEGEGRLRDVQLLGGRSIAPGPTGFFPSGTDARWLFTPNPGDPGRLVLSAGERAVIGVSGDSAPGRGNWFFTPAPLFFSLDALGIGLVAPVKELTFVQVEYRPSDRGFHLALDYEGHTYVNGRFEAPAVVLRPAADPYEGIRLHRRDFAPPRRAAADAAWWREPIFCGWGAQCHLASHDGRRAPDHATQENYDDFLDALARNDVVPGTVVIDDKWQTAYGTNEPDTAKWPDLRAWIAGRHARGQHVLLWWKAWDAEGVDPELCIRTPDGLPVAIDPTNPRTCELLRRSMYDLLSADGLDADGLKVDFTARTPSGTALSLHGDTWGIALLHELLEVVYTAAKDAKADALLIMQTPHPSFVDVCDMIRLNDMLRLDDAGAFPAVVPQMRHRAAVAHAACPELLVDTDDWAVPDKRTWREYLELKPELGVPSLYYATHLDVSSEALDDDDYAAVRRTWERWRAA